MAQPSRSFKVKQELTGSTIYRAWNKWVDGEFIIGKYINKKLDKYGKNNYLVRVIESNIDIEEGKVIGLNACGSIDNALADVAFEETIQVIYTGMMKLTDGKFKGKDCHTCNIAIMQEEGTEQEVDL